MRTIEESELGYSIGEAIFGQNHTKAECFALLRSRKEEDGVKYKVVAQFEELIHVVIEFGSRAAWLIRPKCPEVGMRPYVLPKVGEMILREQLQFHMLASQGLGSGFVCRVGVGDDFSKDRRVVRHAGILRGGLRCLGSKYNDAQRGRMTFIRSFERR